MNLSEFISNTLFEIAEGVRNAQLRARDLMAINPAALNGERLIEKSYIDFDVSIVVSDAESGKVGGSAKAGGAIKMAPFLTASAEIGGSGEKEKESTSASTHRISFRVPVYMNADFRDNPATATEARRVLGSDK